MDLIEFEEKQEKAVLVCVDMGLYDADSSLDELEELNNAWAALGKKFTMV